MRLLLLTLAATLALPLAAQTRTVEDIRTIRVSGTGEASAPSDEAQIVLSFTTEGPSAEEALAQHSVEVDRVQSLLAERGIGADQITLNRASVSPAGGGYGGMNGMGDEDGEVSVSRQLTIRTPDLAAVPELIAALSTDAEDDALTVQVRNVNASYHLSDDADLREEALRNAVEDARRRATLLAEMADIRVGAVLDIGELGAGFGGGGGMDSFMGMAMARAMSGDGMEGMGQGEHTVSAVVVVTFAIEE